MRVGSIQYATDQGIAMLAKSFYDAGVVTDMMVYRHGSRPQHMEWYKEGTIELVKRPFNGPKVEAFIKAVDVMLFFETPFDWNVLDLCRRLGTPTVLVPMYECTPSNPPYLPDKIISPSLLDVEYYPGSEFIPIPVPSGTWKQRTTARRFLHNGGNLGLRGHKGTLELMKAMQYVESDLTLHIRAQDVAGVKAKIAEVPRITKDPRVTFEFGSIPYDDLFAEYDVLIAPEKYNGLSLPLQEARAAGMVVMTSDRFPHNTWLPDKYLIPVSGYQKARIGGAYNVYDEAVIDPKDIAKTMDAWYNADITSYSEFGRVWGENHSWEALKPRWIEALSI